jgi:hypothetical protein
MTSCQLVYPRQFVRPYHNRTHRKKEEPHERPRLPHPYMPRGMSGQAAALPETTECYRGCGQATRKVRMEDKHGQMHEIEVTL